MDFGVLILEVLMVEFLTLEFLFLEFLIKEPFLYIRYKKVKLVGTYVGAYIQFILTNTFDQARAFHSESFRGLTFDCFDESTSKLRTHYTRLSTIKSFLYSYRTASIN